MDDEALLRRCRDGDEQAWQSVLTRYERLVYSIPFNLGLGADDAADVAQATFAALVGSINRIDEPKRLGAWLSTVAKRQSIRVIERRVRERANPEDRPDSVDDEAVHRLAADMEWLHQGLLRISPKCRRILIELYFSQSSYESTAASLEMPVGSLGPTRSRCLHSLQTELAELQDAARER
jgi:RNA polymerase sigma factor (sigma-70 family)